MIFLTVGTTKLPFLRLLTAVDKVLVDLKSNENLVAQIGPNHYKFIYQKVITFSEIPFAKMIFYFSRSRLVISHAGVGTVFLTLLHNKHMPVLIPRIKKLGEHVDDHQILLTKYLMERNLIKGIFPNENLVDNLKLYINRTKKSVAPNRKNRESLIKHLHQYTEG